MISIALAGAGVGLGVWLVSLGFRARPSLLDVGHRLDAQGRTPESLRGARGEVEEALSDRLTALLVAIGMDPRRRAADLRVTRQAVSQHVLAKLAWMVGLGAFGALMGLLLSPVAGAVPMLILVTFGAPIGFFVPDLILTSRAAEARKAFRHAFSGYLDLVNVMLAAGAGPESALQGAAESGGGWAFGEIRAALESARRTRLSVAEAFSQLADELGISELEELAASMSLVGRQGARVRESLATKADGLRVQQLAETEAAAESATEQMTVPVALLLVGFLVLLVYPAVMLISQVEGGAG
jgi:Flp pilus assembly protein TadB